ncbi:MAG: biopolymer transporter ExbD [Acidobacteria bacterium]|uniref:Biopolymer transporter ExbD n=1 Tax=Candidatus Polarisedimenticola svalbardensis TaxID=2886004 RepID=A0A8J6Y548_9BACT|nr:biopolymer transporter ExbD [Candidatus Polarisedimenticola svalbardensis]
MKVSRRIARMTRNRRIVPKLNLTSLMDVFTVLVFFLMINSATVETLHQPKEIKLPESVIEQKPRETVVIFVGRDEVLVQGVPVARIADIQATTSAEIEPISVRLAELSKSVIGLSTKTVAESQEVTVLADKSIPFSVLKKIMATCTGQGYTRVSLAVIQKSAQTP